MSSKEINDDLGVEFKTPKILLFDLGHVFLDAKYKIIIREAAKLGVAPEIISLCFNLDEYKDFGRGKIDGHFLCTAIRAATQMTKLTDEQIRGVHDEHIVGLIPGMTELLESLNKKFGFGNIVFVTDTCDWQTARQQQLIDLHKYRVITSNELGFLKSDPEDVDQRGRTTSYFLKVLEILKLPPQDVLLIDDNPENIVIGNKYGMQTIRFENKVQLEAALVVRNILQ